MLGRERQEAVTEPGVARPMYLDQGMRAATSVASPRPVKLRCWRQIVDTCWAGRLERPWSSDYTMDCRYWGRSHPEARNLELLVSSALHGVHLDMSQLARQAKFVYYRPVRAPERLSNRRKTKVNKRVTFGQGGISEEKKN